LFENIYRRSFTTAQHLSAAHAESKASYLDYMAKQGCPRATIRAWKEKADR